MHKVIGEGSYGCVHKPSLTCKNKTFNYKNKISKIIQTNLGEKELEEYEKIAKVDKNNDFSLQLPKICTPRIDLENLRAIDKCDNFKMTDIDQYSLLVMPDGGINLNELVTKLKDMDYTSKNKTFIMNFWLNVHTLLKGIKTMIEHSIIHHDLKPGNIVFNEETQRLNLIDFGFMEYKSTIIKGLKQSNFKLARPYWYFQFELVLMNRNVFLKVSRSNTKDRKKYFERLIKNQDHETELHMQIFYDKVDNSKYFIDENNELFFNLFMNLDEKKYDEYLEKVLNTIDIYGLGVSFAYVLNNCEHLMEPNIHKELMELCRSMTSASLEIRPNIYETLQRYEIIMEKSGILLKKNMYFINHELHKRDKLLNILYKSLVNKSFTTKLKNKRRITTRTMKARKMKARKTKARNITLHRGRKH